MAGTDPRRSSRARTTQPLSHTSSTPSSTSGRAERNTRSFAKLGSPQKSTASGSLSSESFEDTITAEDHLTSRRRTRNTGEERDRAIAKPGSTEMTSHNDGMQDEDEAVRCICGHDDYPGPPPLEDDSKPGLKDASVIDPIFTTDLTDDMAGFFVQCDICKVWQHGACVGIMTEESSPDEYFCETCRKDLHKIFTAKNGQRYSHYLPLKRHSRSSRSMSLNKEGTKSPKEKDGRNGRNPSATHPSKRRSTLNSREAGYDEAEALRRAIEASKEESTVHDHVDGSARRAPKRGRSDSEEKSDDAKRQRTSSRSVSPLPEKSIDDSDSAISSLRRNSKSKSRNGTATRNQRTEKVATDKEEQDRLLAEQLGSKRKPRAERRRADDSDPPEEMPLASRTAVTLVPTTNPIDSKPTPEATPPHPSEPPPPPPPAPTPSQAVPDTPPTHLPPPTKADRKRSHKKKGRNQYTRDRDNRDEASPARSQSRDFQRDDHGGGGGGGGRSAGEAGSKSGSRNKGGMNSKITMTDLKRRATALLDFISRTQVELAGEALPSPEDNSDKSNGDAPSLSGGKRPSPREEPAVAVDIGASQAKDFRDMNCMEMMDSLTRRLVKWQQEYAS